jgi:transposase
MGMDISVLGVDLGKNVCSVVGLDASGAVVLRRRAKGQTLIALAAKLPPCVVAMEACCGAHHLGRVFAGQPHRRDHRQPVAESGGKGGAASRSEKNAVGYDAGKKVKGHKIHALVDVEGLPLHVIVHPAGIQDRDGAVLVLDKIRQRFPWLELIWADACYNAHQVKDAVARSPGLRLEIVKRTDDIKGFVVLPRRWVVERTFSWFGRNRRLAKDYQNLAETLAAFVTLAAIQFAIRRLARR